jgi:two-component system, LytTR family, response regulator
VGAVVHLPAGNAESPIRVLVVDDEPTARQRMVRLLGGMPGVTTVGVCVSGREAIEVARLQEPELIFLDIAMPGIDGLEVARRSIAPDGPVVIFVTAYDEHALEAFRIHAADYVLKPIDQARLRDAVEHARTSIRRMRSEREAHAAPDGGGSRFPAATRFAVRDGRRTYFVAVSDILWIESFGNYARVYSSTSRYIHRATMASIAAELAPHGFARIHRTVIVNVARITQLRPTGSGQYEVILDSGTRLRVSRTFRSTLESVWRL